MFDTPYYFEPTFTFMGFQDLSLDVRPPFAVEGRRAVEVTHLALLGVKIAETAFWVYLKKSSRNAAAFLRHDIPGKASKYSPLRIK